MDKFPEAFNRFEKDVNTDRIKSFTQLKMAFSSWAGERWINSLAQNEALKNEAGNLELTQIPTRWIKQEPEWARNHINRNRQSWRFETVKVKGRSQPRYRDLKTGRFIKNPR